MREFSCAKGVSQIHHTLYSLYLGSKINRRKKISADNFFTVIHLKCGPIVYQNLKRFGGVTLGILPLSDKTLKDNLKR